MRLSELRVGELLAALGERTPAPASGAATALTAALAAALVELAGRFAGDDESVARAHLLWSRLVGARRRGLGGLRGLHGRPKRRDARADDRGAGGDRRVRRRDRAGWPSTFGASCARRSSATRRPLRSSRGRRRRSPAGWPSSIAAERGRPVGLLAQPASSGVLSCFELGDLELELERLHDVAERRSDAGRADDRRDRRENARDLVGVDVEVARGAEVQDIGDRAERRPRSSAAMRTSRNVSGSRLDASTEPAVIAASRSRTGVSA